MHETEGNPENRMYHPFNYAPHESEPHQRTVCGVFARLAEVGELEDGPRKQCVYRSDGGQEARGTVTGASSLSLRKLRGFRVTAATD